LGYGWIDIHATSVLQKNTNQIDLSFYKINEKFHKKLKRNIAAFFSNILKILNQ
jgi:hypothetical protein